jgi:RNA polymerase sigma factor (sigma-70 family)
MATALDGPPYTASSPEVAREDRANTCDDGLAAFMSMRPRLFGIAYRMLGRAAEAEDVVQDVWVRWQTADRSLVRDAAAFLATTTTRLAINIMQSARARRERHAEPWPQEPADTTGNPQMGTESYERLRAGLLLLLETLSPRERAAYILREAFDYTYRDIANALRLEEANARQVVTRARQRVATGCRIPATSTEQRRLLEAFIAAATSGDVASLEGTLCDRCRDRSKRQRVSIARTAPVDAPHARGQGAAA